MSLSPPKHEDTTPPPQHMSRPRLPSLVDEDILPLFVLPPSSGDTSVDGVNMGPLDFDRLAFLGRAAIQWIVSVYLFNQERLSTDEVEVLHQELTNPQTWARWASLYDNFSYLGHGLRDDVTQGARVFSAYVGGVYRQEGIQQIQDWILALIAHMKNATVLNSPSPEPHTLLHASTGYNTPTAPTYTPTQSRKRDRETPSSEEGRSSPSPKRPRVSLSQTDLFARRTISGSSSSTVRRTATTPASAVIIGRSTLLSFTSADIPAASSSKASPSSVSTQQDIKLNFGAWSSLPPQKKWVSVLNEGCMVTKAGTEWKTESSGADHMKTWRAALTVPQLGIFTIGQGKTKKIAQEEAAQQACEELGWM